MMIFGQNRYLSYEISPGCSDCSNVFPQCLDLLRLHDSQCSFYQIATAPDVYDWSILDAHLDSCEQRGVQVLYTFSYTPEWAYRTDYVPEWSDPGSVTPHSNYPPQLDVFEAFFRALLDHVRRPDGSFRIQYFEAWNETNALAFWNGTDDILMEQQQMLWNVLQEVAPACSLTTPTPTKNLTTVEQALDNYLAMGFQNYSHIVSFHGYADVGTPGAAIGSTLEAVNEVMAKYNCSLPLWDTEWNWTQGYPDDGCIPIGDVSQWIKDALIARLENRIACAIWFQWDNPNGCGYMLDDPTWKGHVNAAGNAWIDLYNSIHPLPAVTDLSRVSVPVPVPSMIIVPILSGTIEIPVPPFQPTPTSALLERVTALECRLANLERKLESC
ncbi:MAG TPA: hypothetical protein VFD98_02425 [Terracidiphilus sp.]|nr:hypothetical protein [Terracidiphilus sp.]